MTTEAAPKTGELVKADPAVVRIEQMIGQNKAQMAALLGKHISVERLFQMAMTSISRVPKLKDCTTASILGCVMESSRLRLAAGVGAGGTWLIPRENKHTGQMECTLIVDYRAIILMMQRDAGVGPVIAEAVRAKDPFRYGVNSGGPFLEWEPAKGDRGAIIGYVAASWSKADRKLTGVIYKTVEEIKSANMRKSMAAQKGEGPWATDPEWMHKKSVIRPLAKLNPGTENDDLSRAVALDERADLDLPQNLHLLADATEKPQLESEAKAAAALPPTAGKNDKPPAGERIAWVRADAVKKGVDEGRFDAWAGAQAGDVEAVADAVEKEWSRLAKSIKAGEKYDAFAPKDAGPREKTLAFKVTGVASSEFNDEDNVFVIRDDKEPATKRFTNVDAVVNAAKKAKESGTDLVVKTVEKPFGKHVFDWLTQLA